MDKPKLTVCLFSGGKDSTAMLLRMLELRMKVDIILFCDTGLEFPQLYDHIHKVKQDMGRKITVIRGEGDFEYLFVRKNCAQPKNVPCRAVWHEMGRLQLGETENAVVYGKAEKPTKGKVSVRIIRCH